MSLGLQTGKVSLWQECKRDKKKQQTVPYINADTLASKGKSVSQLNSLSSYGTISTDAPGRKTK